MTKRTAKTPTVGQTLSLIDLDGKTSRFLVEEVTATTLRVFEVGSSRTEDGSFSILRIALPYVAIAR